MIWKRGMGRIKADMILITQEKNNFIKVKNHPFSFWSTQKQIKEKKLSNYMAKNEKFQSFFLICLLFFVFSLFVIILSQKFQPVKALEKLPWVTFSLIFNIQKKREEKILGDFHRNDSWRQRNTYDDVGQSSTTPFFFQTHSRLP